MDVTNQTSQDDVLIEYVKEKEMLKADLKEKDKEIMKQKSKVYDLMQKIDELRSEVEKLKQNSASKQQPNNSGNKGGARPNTSKASKLKAGKNKQKSNAKSSQAVSNQQTPEPQASGSDAALKDDEATKMLEHYKEVAKKYPELKLSVILESERVFKEGDINNDGTIDEEELEKMLSKQGHIYTRKELREIMSQIDADDDNSIDIMEYLAVMERVQMRKRVNLPSSLTKSAACAIQ